MLYVSNHLPPRPTLGCAPRSRGYALPHRTPPVKLSVVKCLDQKFAHQRSPAAATFVARAAPLHSFLPTPAAPHARKRHCTGEDTPSLLTCRWSSHRDDSCVQCWRRRSAICLAAPFRCSSLLFPAAFRYVIIVRFYIS